MTRNEMDELLADYAFGRLDSEKSEQFKANLDKFPDIADEVEEVRKVFVRIEKMNFDEIIDSKTRNLTVKVNNRIIKQQRRQSSFGFLLKFAVPAAVIITISIAYFQGGFNKQNDNNPTEFSNKLNNLVEIQEFDNNNITDYLNDFEPDYLIENFASDGVLIDNILGSNSSNKIDLLNALSNTSTITDYNLYDEIDELNEDEFQLLLEEIKNVQI